MITESLDIVKDFFHTLKMLEKRIEKYLVDQVKKAGGRAYKFSSPANRGVSDRIVLLAGRIWFVELKTLGGKQSPLQKVFQEEVESLGFEYVLLWTKDQIDGFIKSKGL